MKHGWDDILRFLFNAVLVLAVIGLLLFDFVRWVL